ncbi:LysR family transcriptional regulator [Telmatospirillum sp.]|uniref:LysR family transcriptional regulator n=1 Tax=Telmatospirillum sp. TaxID=2079197 RepID=UPI00284C3457|nr:LysR family transcriptional regulator [Telmatospirillum sp.]MDR3435685.1 LysR family transcriptional regulator [Telmatospirillum sp.]
MLRTTIEQWQVLETIVAKGGFAQAARELNRSQSSVSYAVAQLQERLGLPLLRIEGRRAQLTEAGRALLEDAAPLIEELAILEERAAALARGDEPRLRLAVDSIYPKPRLFAALSAFRHAHRHTRLDLKEVVRIDPDEVFSTGAADLCVATHEPGDYLSQHLLDVELMAVASPGHPLLADSASERTMGDLSRHLLVTIHDRVMPMVDSKVSDRARQHWTVNSIEAAIAAVSSGMCFGWLPKHMIEGQLDDGSLLPIRLGPGLVRTIPLYLIHADPKRAGPVVRALAVLISQA